MIKKFTTQDNLIKFVMVLVLVWLFLIFTEKWDRVPYVPIVLANDDTILGWSQFGKSINKLDHWRIDSENEFRAFRKNIREDGGGDELGDAPIDFSKKTKFVLVCKV
jgi:hypothetical protein